MLIVFKHTTYFVICGIDRRLDPITDYNAQLWQRAELMEMMCTRREEEKAEEEGIEKQIDSVKKELVETFEKQATAVSLIVLLVLSGLLEQTLYKDCTYFLIQRIESDYYCTRILDKYKSYNLFFIKIVKIM